MCLSPVGETFPPLDCNSGKTAALQILANLRMTQDVAGVGLPATEDPPSKRFQQSVNCGYALEPMNALLSASRSASPSGPSAKASTERIASTPRRSTLLPSSFQSFS